MATKVGPISLSGQVVIPPAPAKAKAKETAPAPAAEVKTAPSPKPAPATKALGELNEAGKRIAAKKAAAAAKKIDKAVANGTAKMAKTLTKAAAKGKPAPAPKPEKGGETTGKLCSLCHKPLTRPDSVSAGMGDICQGHIAALPEGVTIEQHYEKLQLKAVPEGWITMSEAVKAANEAGISTYRFLQCTGGDRALRKPLSKFFQVKFYHRTRYISRECLQHLDDARKK